MAILYTLEDYARASGTPKTTMHHRWRSGKLARPAHTTVQGRPMWTQEQVRVEIKRTTTERGQQ